MYIEKEIFEKIILMSDYTGYYYNILVENLFQYEGQKEQIQQMHYLLENNCLEKVKDKVRYSSVSRSYKIPRYLQKDFKMMEETVGFISTINFSNLIPKESIKQHITVKEIENPKNKQDDFKQLIREFMEVLY